RNAMLVWDDIQQARSGPSYRERLDADPEFPICDEELEIIFDPWGFLSRIDVLFDRLEELSF
ncbi:MAG: adenylosuccinate lyase, partial [Actinomycetota bacterium]|nr:adenylosuccinate lyase [Actinomycetota bacterium]